MCYNFNTKHTQFKLLKIIKMHSKDYLYYINSQINVEKYLISTIKDVVFKKNLVFVKYRIFIFILRIIQAAFSSLVPLSYLNHVLIFDYIYQNNLPNEFNIVVISTISMSVYFTKVLHFQSVNNQFIILPYFIWTKKCLSLIKIFKTNQNSQIFNLINNTSKSLISFIKIFYFAYGK